MTKEELNEKNVEDLRTIARVCGLTDVDDLDKETLIDRLAESTGEPETQNNRGYERQGARYEQANSNAAASQARDILDQIKAKKAGMTLEEYREKQRQAQHERQENQYNQERYARQDRPQRREWQERPQRQRDNREQEAPSQSASTQARDILDQIKAKKAGLTLEEYRQQQNNK